MGLTKKKTTNNLSTPPQPEKPSSRAKSVDAASRNRTYDHEKAHVQFKADEPLTKNQAHANSLYYVNTDNPDPRPKELPLEKKERAQHFTKKSQSNNPHQAFSYGIQNTDQLRRSARKSPLTERANIPNKIESTGSLTQSLTSPDTSINFADIVDAEDLNRQRLQHPQMNRPPPPKHRGPQNLVQNYRQTGRAYNGSSKEAPTSTWSAADNAARKPQTGAAPDLHNMLIQSQFAKQTEIFKEPKPQPPPQKPCSNDSHDDSGQSQHLSDDEILESREERRWRRNRTQSPAQIDAASARIKLMELESSPKPASTNFPAPTPINPSSQNEREILDRGVRQTPSSLSSPDSPTIHQNIAFKPVEQPNFQMTQASQMPQANPMSKGQALPQSGLPMQQPTVPQTSYHDFQKPRQESNPQPPQSYNYEPFKAPYTPSSGVHSLSSLGSGPQMRLVPLAQNPPFQAGPPRQTQPAARDSLLSDAGILDGGSRPTHGATLIPSSGGLEDEDFINCTLCHRKFNEPKLLPCLHSFCLECLHKYISDHAYDAASQGLTATHTFRCPSCSTAILLPANGAYGFRPNSFLTNLGDLMATSHVQDQPCGVCSLQGDRTKTATHKCIECGDYLCSKCANMHTFTKYTAKHRVIALADLQSGNYQNELREKQRIYCARHETKIVQIYCMDCETAVCDLCTRDEHRTHNLSPIDQALLEYQTSIAGNMEKLRSSIRDQNHQIQAIDDRRTKLNINKNQVEQAIRDRTNHIKEIINEAERLMLLELEDGTRDAEDELTETRTLAQLKVAQIREAYDFAKKLFRFGKDEEVVQLASPVNVHIEALAGMSIVHPPAQITVQFIPDTDPEDYLRNRKPLLGTVERKQVGNCHLELQFSSKSNSDKHDPMPTGLAVNPITGDIIIVDYANKKVKTFSETTGQLKSEYVCEHFPWNVACLSNGQTIFTESSLERSCQMNLLDTNRRLLLTKKVPNCRGVCVTKEESQFMLVTTTERNNAGILIFQPDGTLMGRIDTKNGYAKPFEYPWYICSKRNGDLIISDRDTETMYLFSPSGDLLYTYSSLVHGVTVDIKDNIIIADEDGSSVLLLTPQGKLLRKLLSSDKDGVRNIRALAISKHGQLIVTEATGMIKIFRY